jgi:carbon storage regulator
MLVLSRKEKQTILVGDDIEITICRVSGRRVSIGLSAPKNVDIRRGEIRSELARKPSKVMGLACRLPSHQKVATLAEAEPALAAD